MSNSPFKASTEDKSVALWITDYQTFFTYYNVCVLSILVKGLMGNWVRLDCRIAVANQRQLKNGKAFAYQHCLLFLAGSLKLGIILWRMNLVWEKNFVWMILWKKGFWKHCEKRRSFCHFYQETNLRSGITPFSLDFLVMGSFQKNKGGHT